MNNMKIQDPNITNAITLTETTTPTNPASSNLKMYVKTDNKIYKLTSAGTETEIGAGGGTSVLEVQVFS